MTTLPHAIYGSATGLGDYRILASTAPFDDRLRSTIIYYANLEGSARSTPFAPIFSFYSLGDNRWAFSRTLCLGATPRGNDYLVHAIVLDAAAMAEIDYKPFALEPLFISQKPREGSVLRPLECGGRGRRLKAVAAATALQIAPCIRALARGPLRLRMREDATEICREIHESLPPDDRLATTFCTRFSYGRNLAFQLAAFVAEDESRVRETAPNATLVDVPQPAAGAPDLFDRWTSEMRGQDDFDLVGLSVLRDVQETFALLDGVRQLRHWTAGDVRGLEKAAALVLRRENRGREVVQSVLPGAFAVDLVRRVRAGEVFDENEVEPAVRRAAVQWLRELQTTPAEAWMAEMLLLLVDGPLADVEEGLKRVQLASRPFLSTLFARMRDRFGADGARVAAAAAPLLSGDALLGFVRAMEETGSRDWLLAIVRDVPGIAPAIPARIILTNGLLSTITDAELEKFGAAFFVLEEKLVNALANTPAVERPALYRVLADVAQMRMREGWTPATDVVRRVMVGGVEAGVPNAHLTVLVFLWSAGVPPAERAASSPPSPGWRRGTPPTSA
ncbi:MAG: hypothetical protein ACJ74H_16935, partial [Thermoanaerobaculia bacterium]